MCKLFPVDTRLPRPDVVDSFPVLRTPSQVQHEWDACKSASLIGVPTLRNAHGHQVYQIVPGQPHLLAFQGIRRAPVAVRLSLTANDPRTQLHANSSDYRSDFKVSEDPLEAITPNDHKAPIYVVFDHLSGTHILTVEAFFKNQNGKLLSRKTILHVQSSRLNLAPYYEELIDRFRFKMTNDIRQRVMCPISTTPEKFIPMWSRVLEHSSGPPGFRMQPLRPFNGKKLLESQTFLKQIYRPPQPGKSNVLASALYLIDHLGPSKTVLDNVVKLLENFKDSDTEKQVTPQCALEMYQALFSPPQSPDAVRPTPTRRTTVPPNVARDAFAISSDFFPVFTAISQHPSTVRPQANADSESENPTRDSSPSPPPSWAQVLRSVRHLK